MDLFGFGLNKAGEYEHYYSNEDTPKFWKPKEKPGAAHNMKSEADTRQKMADEGIITLYPGVIR